MWPRERCMLRVGMKNSTLTYEEVEAHGTSTGIVVLPRWPADEQMEALLCEGGRLVWATW